MSNPDSTIRTAIWIRDTYLKMETLSDVLFRVVEGYLSVALFDTARFYAERLLCCCCNDISTQIERKYSYNASLHQLALCYFRLGKFQQTYLILLDQCSSASTLPASPFAQKYKYSLEDNKYLFALACFGLDKLIEAEKVLLTVSFTDLAASKRLLASSILHLLGKICRRQHRRDVAIKYFTDSLKLDPFLWSSITELSELGVDIDLAGLIGSGQKVAPIAATFQKTSKLQNMEVVETLSSGVSSSIDFEKTVNVTGGKYVLTQTANAMQLPAGRASMSLGLSSLSLRVPFSSPFGGMPSPIHSVDTGFSRAAADPAPYTVDRSLSTDLNQSHSYVDQGQASATSDLTYSNLNLSSGVGVDPRTTLFGLPTPADNSISLSVSTPPRRTAGESGDQPDPLSLGHSGLTQDLLVTRLSVPATGRDTASISGVRQRLNPPSTSQSSRVPHSGSSTGGPQAYSRPSGRTEGQGGGRRVSFGPTARLSFGLGQNTDRSQFPLSPSGVGGIGAVTGLGGMGGTGAAASISSSGSSSIDLNFPGLSSSSSSSSEGTVGGEQKAILREEDEHPFKLQRKGSATAKGGHFGGDSSEPNLSPKSNSQSKQPSRSPFPVESSPVLHPVDATTYSNSAAHSPPRSLRGVDTARIMTDKSLPAAGPASASSAADSKKPFQQKQRQASTATSSAGLPSSSSQAKEGSDSVSSSELGLVQIVGIFARAYQLLCAYRCRECVTVLHELPLTHFRSALVSQLIGKAYYEMNEYKPAVLALREMLKLEPFRLQGLDTLSTALWHLKKDKELCALAQQVGNADDMFLWPLRCISRRFLRWTSSVRRPGA